MILKKKLKARIKKKKKKEERKERWSNQSPMALDWTEKCLALTT